MWQMTLHQQRSRDDFREMLKQRTDPLNDPLKHAHGIRTIGQRIVLY